MSRAQIIGISILILGLVTVGIWYFLVASNPQALDTPYEENTARSITDGEWQLHTYEQDEVIQNFANPQHKIAFSPRRIAGAVCQVFTGPVTITESQITVGALQVGGLLCTDPVLAEVETALIALSGQTLPYVIDEAENSLTLALPNGSRFTFRHGN